MKKLLLSLAAIVLVFLGLIVLVKPTFPISITEVEVNEKARSILPISHEKHGIEVVINDLEVDFLDSNHAQIYASAKVEALGRTAIIHFTTTSGVRYEGGDFYLKDVSVQNVLLEKFQTAAATPSLWEQARNGFDGEGKRGVDSSERPSRLSLLDRIEADLLDAVRPTAEDALVKAFENFPVYSLNSKDYKHSLAALALDDLAFTENSVEIIMSPGKATLKLLLGALSLLAAAGLTVAIFRSGGVGLLAIFGVGNG